MRPVLTDRFKTIFQERTRFRPDIQFTSVMEIDVSSIYSSSDFPSEKPLAAEISGARSILCWGILVLRFLLT